MTHSMTGFASASVSTDQATVTVELRSVNNRFLDLHFRMPESVRAIEPEIRSLISKKLARGKVDVQIKVQSQVDTNTLQINRENLDSIIAGMREIAALMPESPLPNQLDILMTPGVLNNEESTPEDIAKCTKTALNQALEVMLLRRAEEGEKLEQMIRERCVAMRALLEELKINIPLLRESQQNRIRERIEAINTDADAKRLEEEIIYYAQRSDVDEEIDRLYAHLDAIDAALKDKAPCGRRLDFLMQELNREANTLSSKSTALSTTNTAVEFKVLIEQMREQIQNIE